jgi:cell division protein FtsL
MSTSQRNRYLRSRGSRKKRSGHPSQIFLLIFFLAIAATVAYVWERAQVIRQQMLISELKAQVQKLETENEYLQLELLHLSNATSLEQIARKIGFVHPSAGQIVRLPR